MFKNNVSKPTNSLLLILLFIFGDVICENYIFRAFNEQILSLQMALFVGVLTLQSLAAPIQASFSDLYCRKKSLVFSLSATSITIILLFLLNLTIVKFLPILIILSFIKGGFGNTIPLSWAAIADTQNSNYRFSFGLSTASYAVAYALLVFQEFYIKEQIAIAIMIVFYILIIYFCIKAFTDIRDKNSRGTLKNSRFLDLIIKEIKLLINDLKKTYMLSAIFAFLLWEIAIYCILLLYVDFKIQQFFWVAITISVGYLTGILALKFCNRVSDSMMSRIGFLFGSVSLLPFYVDFLFSHIPNFSLLAGCFYFYTIGIAILPATLFSMLAKGAAYHEQGRVYGLIESTDTIALLISIFIVLFHNFFQLHIMYVITFSLSLIIVSWFPFIKYEKIRPKELHT